ncbi:MAG: glycosyltransferase WbuB, partial [Armatimonadota bacterium]|nr:glycosyltransferase WbuB [Armatimonadota bacterium]
MRILFLTMYYKPDSAATGLLMAELAEELAEQGHEITVITSMPHYTTNSIWKEYRGRFWIREQQGKIK